MILVEKMLEKNVIVFKKIQKRQHLTYKNNLTMGHKTPY
jgi:hypothetical protein